MKTPRYLPAVAALLALSLGSCSSDGGDGGAAAPGAPGPSAAGATDAATPTEPSEPAGSPETTPSPAVEQPVLVRRIPQRTRRTYFSSSTDGQARNALLCNAGSFSLADSPNLRDHDNVAFVDGDFDVVRQVALYPDAASAADALDVVSASLPMCAAVTGFRKSDFAAEPARFFGVKGNQTVLSQATQDQRGGTRFTVIDVVTTDANAVVWTRIGSDIAVKSGSTIMAKLPLNAPWFAEVRKQGNIGRTLLASLSPAGR